MDFILDLTMCLADYDLRERIHNPVSVSEVLGMINDKRVLNKKYLRNNIYAYSFVFAHS